MIGPISPDMKRGGARSAGNPHAACDVEGAGNVARSNSSAKPARQSSTLLMSGDGKRGGVLASVLAPVLDSTTPPADVAQALVPAVSRD